MKAESKYRVEVLPLVRQGELWLKGEDGLEGRLNYIHDDGWELFDSNVIQIAPAQPALLVILQRRKDE
jgi:hypothetical protein